MLLTFRLPCISGCWDKILSEAILVATYFMLTYLNPLAGKADQHSNVVIFTTPTAAYSTAQASCQQHRGIPSSD